MNIFPIIYTFILAWGVVTRSQNHLPAGARIALDNLLRNNVTIEEEWLLPPGVSWEQMYNRGVMIMGNVTSTLKSKFVIGEPLSILIMGGSISCGARINKKVRYGQTISHGSPHSSHLAPLNIAKNIETLVYTGVFTSRWHRSLVYTDVFTSRWHRK